MPMPPVRRPAPRTTGFDLTSPDAVKQRTSIVKHQNLDKPTLDSKPKLNSRLQALTTG